MLHRNELNSSTTYTWFLLTNTPTDIKNKLRKGMISQKKAFMLRASHERVKELKMGIDIMEEVKEHVINFSP